MRTFFLVIVLTCISLVSFSQNLVINPSFENYSSCPQGPSELSKADNWQDPFNNVIGDTCSTSDFYNACNTFGGMATGVPANILGNEPAHTGNGYAGIIMFEGFVLDLMSCNYVPGGSSNWREYVEGELSQPLVAGQQYCVSFYVSLADNVKWASSDFGVYFSNTLVKVNCTSVSNSVLQYTPQLVYCDSAIEETNGWTRLQWNYTATGGEQYITIGNFKDDNNTTVTCVNPTAFNPYSYYYIDDVSVVAESCCFAEIVAPEESACVTDSEFDLQLVSLCEGVAIGAWSGTGIIDPSAGTFSPSVAGVGHHEVVYTLDCGFSDTTIVIVNECIELLACTTPDGSINVTNGTGPFVWYALVDTVDCSACQVIPFFPPCEFPPGCSVASQEWMPFTTGATIAAPTTWPVKVIDANENVLVVNSALQLPTCENGCFINVTLPQQITVCTDDSASATAVVTGAQGAIVYQWNTTPVQNTATAIGLAPGAYYTITVTDDSLCVAIDSVFVLEQVCVAPTACLTPFGDIYAEGNGPFTWLEYTQTTDCSACLEVPGFPPCAFPPGCGVTIDGYEQFATGELVTPTGNWPLALVDDLGDTLLINNLSQLANCTQSCFLSVDVPAQAYVCSGTANAQVQAVVTGAFGAPSYSWNTTPVQTTAVATNLAAGEYIVTVTDGNSCEATDTVHVLELPPIQLQTSATDSVCLGMNTGTASVAAFGGLGSYQYAWNTTPTQTTATASNLGPGTYTATVTDLAGCSAQISVTIAEKSPITVAFNPTDDVCIGSTNGTATAFVPNSTINYSYSWNTTPVQNGATASGLSAGTYTATATDPQGCQGVGLVTIAALPAVNADAGTFTTTCEGQTITLLATGGVSYVWSTGQTTASVEVSPSSTTLYTVSVTDNNGCEASDTVSVIVVPVPTVGIEELDSVVCDIEPPFQIIGNPPGGTFTGNGVSSTGLFEPLVAGDGTHTITYTFLSTENCAVDTSVTFRVDAQLCDVFTPSIFNPSSDYTGTVDFCGNAYQNNTFNLPCLELYPGNKVLIFDRWGRKCYEQENYHLKPWDGGNQSDGVYYYVLEIPNEEAVKGFFHLVR